MARQLSSAGKDADTRSAQSNSAARRNIIREAVDWVAAAEAEPTTRRPNGSAKPVEPNEEARRQGREDGLGGVHDHAARYPSGERGHADYTMGFADGEAERARVMALGEPAGATAR